MSLPLSGIMLRNKLFSFAKGIFAVSVGLRLLSPT